MSVNLRRTYNSNNSDSILVIPYTPEDTPILRVIETVTPIVRRALLDVARKNGYRWDKLEQRSRGDSESIEILHGENRIGVIAGEQGQGRLFLFLWPFNPELVRTLYRDDIRKKLQSYI